MIVAVTLGYNGALFAGFARQPGLLTVQGEIEAALQTVFCRPVETVCAGRTDSGVHARGQVISFELTDDEWATKTPRSLTRSLLALTHDDISIKSVEPAQEGFSARFSATCREYRYFICTEESTPVFSRDFSWHVTKPLDIDAMRDAASHLIGEHDFKSFCTAASAVGKPTKRNVHSITIEPAEFWSERGLCVTVKGNAFLHSMVRTIVGSLVLVGRGKRTPAWIDDVLAARDREAAGENAPAKGLVFWHVDYDGAL